MKCERMMRGGWVRGLVIAAVAGAASLGAQGQVGGGGGTAETNLPYASSPTSDGTEASPHLILTLAQLHRVRLEPAAHFIQVADIDASDTMASTGPNPWNRPEGFEPLFSVNVPFTGIYDGGGYRIRGLRIKQPGGARVALFRQCQGATIRNLRLENLEVTGGSVVGGLLAWGHSTTIRNVHVAGTVVVDAGNGDASMNGGIAGFLTYSEMNASSFTGRIRLGNLGSRLGSTGGLVGAVGTSTWMTDCDVQVGIDEIASGAIDTMEYDSGIGGAVGSMLRLSGILRTHVRSPEIALTSGRIFGLGVGGIVGTTASGSVIDSHASGGFLDAPAFEGVGGVVGFTYSMLYQRSWSSTEVRSSGYAAGGFIGYSNQWNTVQDCYASGEVLTPLGGGFVGALDEPGLDVMNSYASGNVPSGYGFFGREGMSDGDSPSRFYLTNVFCSGQSAGFGPDCSIEELCNFLNIHDGPGADFFGADHDVYNGTTTLSWDFGGVWGSDEDGLPVLQGNEGPVAVSVGAKFAQALGVGKKDKRRPGRKGP